MSNQWTLFAILELTNYVLAIVMNFLVFYIMLFRFRLREVDTLISFILSSIDIIYPIYGIVDIILFFGTNQQKFQNPVYCKINTVISDTLCAVGLNCVVLLAIIRYLAICRGYLVSKRTSAIVLAGLCSFPVTGIMYVAWKNDPKFDRYSLICSFIIHPNTLSQKIQLWLTAHMFVYLTVILFCYINIMVYYYKTPFIVQDDSDSSKYSSGYSGSVHNMEISASHSEITPEFLRTIKKRKVNSIFKIGVIITIFFIQLAPWYTLQLIISIIPSVSVNQNLSQFFLFLTNLIPLTNTFLVLFFHEETHQELKFIRLLWFRRVKNFWSRVCKLV